MNYQDLINYDDFQIENDQINVYAKHLLYFESWIMVFSHHYQLLLKNLSCDSSFNSMINLKMNLVSSKYYWTFFLNHSNLETDFLISLLLLINVLDKCLFSLENRHLIFRIFLKKWLCNKYWPHSFVSMLRIVYFVTFL